MFFMDDDLKYSHPAADANQRMNAATYPAKEAAQRMAEVLNPDLIQIAATLNRPQAVQAKPFAPPCTRLR